MSGSKLNHASSGVPLGGGDRSVGGETGDACEPPHDSHDAPSQRRQGKGRHECATLLQALLRVRGRAARGRLGGGRRRRRRRHTVHTLPTVKLKRLLELLLAVAESREIVRVFHMKLAIRRCPRQLIPMTIACLTYLAHQAPFAPLEKPDHFDHLHIGPACVQLH